MEKYNPDYFIDIFQYTSVYDWSTISNKNKGEKISVYDFLNTNKKKAAFYLQALFIEHLGIANTVKRVFDGTSEKYKHIEHPRERILTALSDINKIIKYTPEYFINFFTKIPDEQWCINSYNDLVGRKCALGHLGAGPTYSNDVSLALIELFYKFLGIQSITEVNDGEHPGYQQETPKQRIIAALHDIKRIQNKLKAQNK